MSRELKFRVWLQWRENDPWRMYLPEDPNGCFHIHQDGGSVYNCTPDSGYGYGGGDSECVHASIVMQFTGLKDRNGKDIYEGDILRGEKYNAVVTWRTELSGYILAQWTKKANKDVADLATMDTKKIEAFYFIGPESDVIGNIYENPELIQS